MTRTYTLDADMCDRWAALLSGGPATDDADRPMLDAIRAQQPKPWIQFAYGRRMRRRDIAGSVVLRCVSVTVDPAAGLVPGILVEPNDSVVGVQTRAGVRYNGTNWEFDPEKWEVVE